MGDASEMENDVTKTSKVSGWKQKEPEVSLRKNPPVGITMDIRCYMQKTSMCTNTTAVLGKTFSDRDYTKPIRGPDPPPPFPPPCILRCVSGA